MVIKQHSKHGKGKFSAKVRKKKKKKVRVLPTAVSS